MKIACCTMEMITLVFLLLWSFNAAFSVVNAPLMDLVSRSTTEPGTAWGEPESAILAADLGFSSPQLNAVEG